MTGHYAHEEDKHQREVLQRARLRSLDEDPNHQHLADCCFRVQLDRHEVRLFGVTEDLCCQPPETAAKT